MKKISMRQTPTHSEKVIYEEKDGIAVITMHCPENLNAVDEQMTDELLQALDTAEHSDPVGVIILRGMPRAFSAGGDIGYFREKIGAGGRIDMDDSLTKAGQLALKMKSMSKIIITSVCGAAAGAGLSIALGGDFMICAQNARFIMAFVNLGLAPDTGAVYLLSKSIGASRALRFAVTGHAFSAAEALELGLAHQIVPAEELEDATLKFAKKLACGPLLAYKNIKKQVFEVSFHDYEDWLKNTELPTQSSCFATEDFREGCIAFSEKRQPVFRGK